MKNLSRLWLAGLTSGWLFTVVAAAEAQTTDSTPAAQPADQAAQPVDEEAAARARLRAAMGHVSGDQTNATTVANTQSEITTVPPVESTNAGTVTGTAENGMRLNLRNVPVDKVLNYLSESAGFTIIRQADTRSGGNVDIVSDKPLSKEEVVELLNKVIANNELAATLDGKTITIMTLEQARLSNKTPVVKYGDDPADIPQDNVVVTEVITMHSLNPTQVVRDLSGLIPQDAKVTANEGGNAILITARRNDIHHFAEIIHALDGSTSGDLEVVFLDYADSKAIAQELKDVFTTDAGAGNNPFAQIFGRGRGGGGGGFGGFGGGGGGGGDAGNPDPKRAPVKVNAVSDDENNAVIVSAPVDIMPGITNLIKKLDIVQDDVIQIKVFGLKHADPNDVVTELSSLFPDPNAQSNNGNNRGRGAQFAGAGGFGFFGGRGGGATASAVSDRMKKQSTVLAVADARTQSVIITAAKDTMVEIKAMIEELDGNPARAIQVYVFIPQNANVNDLQSAMTDLFAKSGQTTSTANNVDPFKTRAQTAAQQQTTSSSSGFGTSSGGGGGGGVGGR